jgi:hypothetical protein
MATEVGLFNPVSGPEMVTAGVGEPDLACCALVNSATAQLAYRRERAMGAESGRVKVLGSIPVPINWSSR